MRSLAFGPAMVLSAAVGLSTPADIKLEWMPATLASPMVVDADRASSLPVSLAASGSSNCP